MFISIKIKPICDVKLNSMAIFHIYVYGKKISLTFFVYFFLKDTLIAIIHGQKTRILCFIFIFKKIIKMGDSLR